MNTLVIEMHAVFCKTFHRMSSNRKIKLNLKIAMFRSFSGFDLQKSIDLLTSAYHINLQGGDNFTVYKCSVVLDVISYCTSAACFSQYNPEFLASWL